MRNTARTDQINGLDFASCMTDARKIALYGNNDKCMIRDHFRKFKEEFLEETARMRDILRDDEVRPGGSGRAEK